MEHNFPEDRPASALSHPCCLLQGPLGWDSVSPHNQGGGLLNVYSVPRAVFIHFHIHPAQQPVFRKHLWSEGHYAMPVLTLKEWFPGTICALKGSVS